MQSASSRSSIALMDAAEWPGMGEEPGAWSEELDARAVSIALSMAAECTAKASVQYAMMGVAIVADSTTIEFVGTDTHRLGIARIAWHGADASAIAMKRGAILMAAAAKAGEWAQFAFTPNQVWMRTEGATISSMQIQGRFPKYRSIIPQSPNGVTVERQALIDAVAAVAPFANYETQVVTLGIGPDGIAVSASREDANASARIPVAGCNGMEAEMPIMLSHHCLATLGHMESDLVDVRVTDPRSPVLCNCGAQLLIIMPWTA
jgi:DNA polymerase III sliding clamp (beta) subunit (PCNA family)